MECRNVFDVKADPVPAALLPDQCFAVPDHTRAADIIPGEGGVASQGRGGWQAGAHGGVVARARRAR